LAKILFLTQIVPFPPDAGPKVKTYHVLRALMSQGHSVTLVSFVRREEKPFISDLEKFCDEVHAVPIRRSRVADIWYMLRSYLTGRPFLIERDDLYPMQKMVNQLVERDEFQFIHADQLTMAQFAIGKPSGFSGKKPKIIFDAHNAVWTIVERMQKNAGWFLKPILTVEMRRVKRYEGGLLKTVDHVLAVTDVDRAGLKAALNFSNLKPDKKVAPITVIPIAVDTTRLQPIQRDVGSNKIITLGTLHYPPNADGIRWFFNEVFPLVQKHVPNAKLTIIGKHPPPDFLELAARNPGTINVTGYVEDLVPYMEESVLMVVPVRAGGGMRVRILEAFAYAMPVVTTTIGLEGIRAVPNHDVLVADDSDQFANVTVELMRNVSLQEKLASNGRKLAEEKYDWQVVLKSMETIYGQETE
jgi:glycosyltransferase involved in cell wall biosynthesis